MSKTKNRGNNREAARVQTQEPPVRTQGEPPETRDPGGSEQEEEAVKKLQEKLEDLKTAHAELCASEEETRQKADEIEADAIRLGSEIQTLMKEIEEAQGRARLRRREEERRKKMFLPAGEPLPETYKKQSPLPCPKCRRRLTDRMGRAVVCTSTTTDLAYLRCRACGNTWKLPIKRV